MKIDYATEESKICHDDGKEDFGHDFGGRCAVDYHSALSAGGV